MTLKCSDVLMEVCFSFFVSILNSPFFPLKGSPSFMWSLSPSSGHMKSIILVLFFVYFFKAYTNVIYVSLHLHYMQQTDSLF